ncbi:MAG: hypothetical protein IJT34_03800, partial [Butyrivibrio sp.]|nr:hypothetical protein [Butyrivibrio sp.]
MNRKAVSLVMAASLVLSGAAVMPTTALAADSVTVLVSSSKDDVTVGDTLDFSVKTTGIDAAKKVLYDWTAPGFTLADNSEWKKTTINAAAVDGSASKEDKSVTCNVYEDKDGDGKLSEAEKASALGTGTLKMTVKNLAKDAGLKEVTDGFAAKISMNETVTLTAVFDKAAVGNDTAVTQDQDLVTGDPMKVTYALKDATTDGAI